MWSNKSSQGRSWRPLEGGLTLDLINWRMLVPPITSPLYTSSKLSFIPNEGDDSKARITLIASRRCLSGQCSIVFHNRERREPDCLGWKLRWNNLLFSLSFIIATLTSSGTCLLRETFFRCFISQVRRWWGPLNAPTLELGLERNLRIENVF